MARFNEFSQFYTELFPEVTPVRNNRVMETATGEKDVREEVKEEVVDETVVSSIEEKELESDGIGTDSIVANE